MTDKSEDAEPRDPNELNEHLKINFEDVFGENEAVNSFNCVWNNSYKCYECGKHCIYKFLTTLCGLCIALAWGCEFGWLAFEHIWCLTPRMRHCSITLACWQRGVGSVINCCCTPFFESIGMCCSRIAIKKL